MGKAGGGNIMPRPMLLRQFQGSSAAAMSSAALLLTSPRKTSMARFGGRAHITSCWLTLLTLFACISMFKFLLTWNPEFSNTTATASTLCSSSISSSSATNPPQMAELQQQQQQQKAAVRELRTQAVVSNLAEPLSVEHHPVRSDLTELEREFWRQPDGQGFKPCVERYLSEEYRRESVGIVGEREKYLMVVVNGGLNQQKNQIVDAVVMARILGANLLVPVLQINPIWEDESEFGDIFDVEHFKTTLKDDVRIVSALPSRLLLYKPIDEKNTPLNASPRWLRAHYAKKMSQDGVLLLRSLDSRLTKDLPPDLQKLRCKVAFHALRFVAPIQELGDKLAARMWSQGSYLAVHLRLEKDVWVRTGCLPGLGNELDEEIRRERKMHPKLLTARTRMGFTARKLAGLCPLTAAELVRLLKALGAGERTRIYWAGGEPFGGKQALEPIMKVFPDLYNKDSLAMPDELAPFKNKASSLAAIDYLVCLNSDVFIQSHGGNFGRVMQGHRAYLGHRKHIVPNKRQMIQHFLNLTMPTAEFDETIWALHVDRIGQPVHRSNKSDWDVLAYPVPECMCQNPLQSS